MQPRPYIALSTLIFILVALAHACRLYEQWSLQVGAYAIPVYASWLGLAIASLLAIWGLALLRR